MRAALEAHQPQLVINASAYNRVDDAESNPEVALAVNALGPRNLALECEALGATLVHISTDYVFSGAGHGRGSPYTEAEPVDPVSAYGLSKAAGEMFVRAHCSRYYVVRVSGLYGEGGNFVRTMLRLAGDGRPLRVVDDQVVTPTSASALSRQLELLCRSDAYGTYHATCQGECSWYEFAAEILRQAGVRADLRPQTTAESGRPARRPTYSALANRGLGALGIDRMPAWQAALSEYLAAR